MTIRLMMTLCMLLACMTTEAQKKVKDHTLYIYRYGLIDKKGTPFTVDKPEEFLSMKSIERRQRQGLSIDESDLPVSEQYIRAEVIGTSRWQNTVVVRSADTLLLQRLGRLSCVRESRCVWISPDKPGKPISSDDDDIKWNLNRPYNEWDSVKNDPYGCANHQIDMLNGRRLHDAGFRGEGMTIGILDGGFQNYDQIPALSKVRVAGTHNFVADSGHFHDIDHGTKVLSALAANVPEVIIGTAPNATYWLLRSEDNASEQPVEEDYWTMAAEFADSVGVDIINSSLGYHEYDGDRGNYRLRDLDGQTAFVSCSASMLAGKGIILCNSAGNSGMGQWKKIGVPADARDILTVGAINEEGNIASFSSVGPSQDGRMKPDVVAQGSPATLISGHGSVIHDMGTSFSTPVTCGMVACLWQSLPQKTAYEIMDLVRQSGDLCDNPNNIYGYGKPDFWKAYQAGQAQ